MIPPVICDQCGDNAQLVRRKPDTAEPNIEFRKFECACGHSIRRAVDLNVSDRDIESLAERMVGRGDGQLGG